MHCMSVRACARPICIFYGDELCGIFAGVEYDLGIFLGGGSGYFSLLRCEVSDVNRPSTLSFNDISFQLACRAKVCSIRNLVAELLMPDVYKQL